MGGAFAQLQGSNTPSGQCARLDRKSHDAPAGSAADARNSRCGAGIATPTPGPSGPLLGCHGRCTWPDAGNRGPSFARPRDHSHPGKPLIVSPTKLFTVASRKANVKLVILRGIKWSGIDDLFEIAGEVSVERHSRAVCFGQRDRFREQPAWMRLRRPQHRQGPRVVFDDLFRPRSLRIRSTLGKLPIKSSGVCVLGCCALRGSDHFTSTVSIRQRLEACPRTH